MKIINTLPKGYTLAQNYPNPFNPTTQIKYSLPKASYVQLEVFSVLGHRISVLESSVKQAREHVVAFYTENLASGVYFYRLSTPEFTQTRFMNLVK